MDSLFKTEGQVGNYGNLDFTPPPEDVLNLISKNPGSLFAIILHAALKKRLSIRETNSYSFTDKETKALVEGINLVTTSGGVATGEGAIGYSITNYTYRPRSIKTAMEELSKKDFPIYCIFVTTVSSKGKVTLQDIYFLEDIIERLEATKSSSIVDLFADLGLSKKAGPILEDEDLDLKSEAKTEVVSSSIVDLFADLGLSKKAGPILEDEDLVSLEAPVSLGSTLSKGFSSVSKSVKKQGKGKGKSLSALLAQTESDNVAEIFERAISVSSGSVVNGLYRFMFRWTFTVNDRLNETNFRNKDYIINVLKMHDIEILYFQLEKGELTGKLHWQGAFKCLKKKRPIPLGQKLQKHLFGVDLRPVAGDWKEAKAYVTKEETRVEGPYVYPSNTSEPK